MTVADKTSGGEIKDLHDVQQTDLSVTKEDPEDSQLSKDSKDHPAKMLTIKDLMKRPPSEMAKGTTPQTPTHKTPRPRTTGAIAYKQRSRQDYEFLYKLTKNQDTMIRRDCYRVLPAIL